MRQATQDICTALQVSGSRVYVVDVRPIAPSAASAEDEIALCLIMLPPPQAASPGTRGKDMRSSGELAADLIAMACSPRASGLSQQSTTRNAVRAVVLGPVEEMNDSLFVDTRAHSASGLAKPSEGTVAGGREIGSGAADGEGVRPRAIFDAFEEELEQVRRESQRVHKQASAHAQRASAD